MSVTPPRQRHASILALALWVLYIMVLIYRGVGADGSRVALDAEGPPAWPAQVDRLARLVRLATAAAAAAAAAAATGTGGEPIDTLLQYLRALLAPVSTQPFVSF
jgi:hypothetical protein